MIFKELKARRIHVVDLSFVGKVGAVLNPELIALKLESRVHPLDVGVFAFSVRGRLDPRKGTYWVDENSLVPSRKRMIVALLDKFWLSGRSAGSINTDIKHLEYGLNWCDANGYSDIFCSAESARLAFMQFSNHLFQEILRPNGDAPLTCQARQTTLKRVLQLHFPDEYENVVAGILPIKSQRDGLEPPEKEAVGKYIDTCLNISITFSRFLVGFAPFPLRFETKEYHTYLFPGTGTFVTPFSVGAHEYVAYSYSDGRILTELELLELLPIRKEVRARIRSAQQSLDDGNSHGHHKFRMRFASLAMQAYACLINFVVGANSGEVTQFLYEDAVGLVKSPLKKELSAIKLRAKGLQVLYTVGRGPGMQILKEYLRFREWLLDGRECDYLFFTVVDRNGYEPSALTPLSSDFSTRFFRKIRGVFVPENSKNIPPVRVRKYKSLTLHLLKHSPLLVSAVMNHHERTNLQSYSEITEKDSKEEFGNYWSAVKKAAERAKRPSLSRGVSIAVGHCDDINKPSKDIPVVAIEPDCDSQYGCLFCVHYLVHSDEEDVHKLVSFQYVINAIRQNAPDFMFSEETFKDVAIRVDAILDAISQRSDEARELVYMVKKKVFDLGVLTPFWERRLQRYEKMGIYI